LVDALGDSPLGAALGVFALLVSPPPNRSDRRTHE
jgi:hypothetical protein